MKMFTELFQAMFQIPAYEGFLENRRRRVFGYGCVLVLLYFLMTIIVPFAKFQVRTGGVGKLVADYIPDFQLADGSLWIDDTMSVDDGNTCIYVDTSEGNYYYTADEMGSGLNDYSQAVFVDSEKMTVKNNGRVQTVYFSDMAEISFSKDALMSFVPMANVIILVVILLIYLFQAAGFFFGALFVALIGVIVISILKVDLHFGQVYLLSVYARTLPVVIKMILKLFSISVPFFWLFNFGISVFYLTWVCMRIRENRRPEQVDAMDEWI